jgi:serine/threonine protein kinase
MRQLQKNRSLTVSLCDLLLFQIHDNTLLIFSGKEADLWGIGVILYEIISGSPPFFATPPAIDAFPALEKARIERFQRELYKQILAGNVTYQHIQFENVSKSAKGFISCLLTRDPDQRITAENALEHPWMKASDDMLEKRKLDENATVLGKYQTARKWKGLLQAVVLTTRLQINLARKISSTKSMSTDRQTFSSLYQLNENEKPIQDGIRTIHDATMQTGETVSVHSIDLSKFPPVQVRDVNQALQKEFDLLASLRHPNIIRVKAVILSEATEDGRNFSYLVFEKLHGSDLTERLLQKDKFTESDARKILRKLLEVLVYLHQQGIVHR